MKDYKILLLNLGYCTKLNGSTRDYITKFHRYSLLSKRKEAEVLDELKKLIFEEKPDLICLTEIKKGKQILSFANNNYPFYDIANKYGKKSFLRKIKPFEIRGNAIIAKESLIFKKHYLKNGTKKLLYEVILPNNTSLFLVHFSLNKKVRAKQFEEIHQTFKKIESKIVCGDFNIFKGLIEINSLMEKSNLRLSCKEPTFPAFKPKKNLDIFLLSKDLKTKTRVLNNQLSDHLPVILEMKINA